MRERCVFGVRGVVLIGLLFFPFLTIGCASTQTHSPPSSESMAGTPLDLSSEEVHARLQQAAEHWESTPHRWGGASRQGVDCSGLVQSIFDEELSVPLPRTTEQQARAGETVERSALQPGDLVFFRPSNRDRHVGIYLSDDQFLHSSSSEGVTISSLDSDYWSNRWWQARRVLTPSSKHSDQAADSPDDEQSRSARTGW